jgi:hypothetical protein
MSNKALVVENNQSGAMQPFETPASREESMR